MALYAKLAVRNVFRNRRRTLITLAAMGFGAAAIIVFGGFVHSIYFGVRESTIRSQVGHIQIYRKGYSEKGNLAPYDYLIADYPALREALQRLPHVRTVTARLGFSGLVSTGDTTTAFVGAGVVPEGEMNLSALAVIVDGGLWLAERQFSRRRRRSRPMSAVTALLLAAATAVAAARTVELARTGPRRVPGPAR